MTSLYDESGKRKYLTPAERENFLEAADGAEREVRTFCHTLAYTGCRISEALQVTADRIDLKGLRHGFGVKGVTKQVPLNMIQKWLGHADLRTTAIYADAAGDEAKDIAARMW